MTLAGRFPTHQLWKKRFKVYDFNTITTQTDPVCQPHKITSGCALKIVHAENQLMRSEQNGSAAAKTQQGGITISKTLLKPK